MNMHPANMLSRALFSQPGISDADLADEHRAQKEWFALVAEVRTRAAIIAAKSDLCGKDILEAVDAMNDYGPPQDYWDEKIMEARRG